MGSKHLERLGGLAAGLGVTNQHMLSAGVRNVEPGALQMNVADFGVPQMHDARAVSDICARPKFAETFAFDQELVDQSAQSALMPASIASSSRRNPGTRRRAPATSPTSSGRIRSRRARR